MKTRPLRAALVILLGLAAAQVIASVHVHLSNMALYEKMNAFRNAGYLIVPNAHVLPRLLEWKSALFGGLFFTLSTGAFLNLLSIAAAWLLHRAQARKKAILLPLLTVWLALLVVVNIRGLSLMPTLYLLLIPILVFFAASRWLFPGPPKRLSSGLLLHALPPLFLALLWASQMSGSFFLDVRDYLLLSHKAGTKVSDFYYRYTLYPAETLKPLDQKLLRAVYFGHIENKPLSQALQRELLKHDYLPVSKETLAELLFRERNNELDLEQGGATILRTTLRQFLPSPGPWLAAFSKETDRQTFFRKVTFVSLLIGLPMLIYLLLYGIFFSLLSLVLPSAKSSVPATLLCLVAGIALFLLFFLSRAAIHDEKDINWALQSGNWRTRVAALKFIHGKGLEAANYPAYKALMASPFIPEKYWLANTLGAGRHPDTFKDLLSLLDDTHPTVVSAAFQALGKRKNPAAMRPILARITTSTDWYNQWNAYRALKALGWKQSPSP
jgi:hypothetical protein